MKKNVPPPRIGINSSKSSATPAVAAQIATQMTVAAITYSILVLFATGSTVARIFAEAPHFGMGRAGIEPATLGLRVPCSTS